MRALYILIGAPFIIIYHLVRVLAPVAAEVAGSAQRAAARRRTARPHTHRAPFNDPIDRPTAVLIFILVLALIAIIVAAGL